MVFFKMRYIMKAIPCSFGKCCIIPAGQRPEGETTGGTDK